MTSIVGENDWGARGGKMKDKEFWYWWDRNVIGKPFWRFMGKVYLFIFGCGIIGYVIASLMRGSWVESISECLTATMVLIVIANVGVAIINTEMSSKYWDADWDFTRNRTKGGK